MSTTCWLAWASKPASRRMMSMVGLPTPQPLRREGPWVAEPLSGQTVVLHGAESLREVIAGLGAEVVTDTEEEPSALVYDARGICTADGLRGLYDFFHSRIRGMGRCGRVVVIGHPGMVAESAQAASASEALLGFVKSLSKEIGRKGSTANLLTVVPGAESGLAGPLRFLLSPRSAFVTGQVLSAPPVSVRVPVSNPWRGRRRSSPAPPGASERRRLAVWQQKVRASSSSTSRRSQRRWMSSLQNWMGSPWRWTSPMLAQRRRLRRRLADALTSWSTTRASPETRRWPRWTRSGGI